jgi:hypothetical protein
MIEPRSPAPAPAVLGYAGVVARKPRGGLTIAFTLLAIGSAGCLAMMWVEASQQVTRLARELALGMTGMALAGCGVVVSIVAMRTSTRRGAAIAGMIVNGLLVLPHAAAVFLAWLMWGFHGS